MTSGPTTRERLVAAAEALLEEGGQSAVTFREVGRRTGLSHNAGYKLFGGKLELLAAVAARGLAELVSTLDQEDSADPLEAVRRMMHAYTRQALDRPRRFELTYGTWSGPLPELEAAAEAARGRLEGTVALAQQFGQMPAGDPARLTALLQSVAHGATQLALTGHLAAAGKGHAGPTDLLDDVLTALALQAKSAPSGGAARRAPRTRPAGAKRQG